MRIVKTKSSNPDTPIKNKTIALVDCIPHSRNYNFHPQAQIETLRASIRTFGQVESIAVQAHKRDDKFTTIAGHGVAEAMRLENYKRVRADIIPASWSQTKALAYLATSNETAKHSTPDEIQLAAIVAEIASAEGEALAALAAGDGDALEDIIANSSLSDEKLTEKSESLKPKKMLRILVSIPLDKALGVKKLFKPLESNPEIEIIYGAN